MNEPPVSSQEPVPQSIRQPVQWTRRQARRTLPFVSGVVVTFVAILLYNLAFPPPKPIGKSDIDTSIQNAIASITPAPAYSSLVYQVIRPSLVLIEAHVPTVDNSKASNDDHLGTGFIFNEDGLILTALHVIEGTSTIKVTFADGTESDAKAVVRQPENDLAVLQASKLPEKIIPAVLGNPGAMQVGDEVYAVGHPFGLYGSMSAGVISGMNRSFKRPNSEDRLTGLIQIDAAVNPGNSGGPLLNRNGEVIGIVDALLNPTDQEVFIGIGFAITITAAGGAMGAPPL